MILTYNTCMVVRMHSVQSKDATFEPNWCKYCNELYTIPTVYTVQEQLPSPTEFRFYSVHITSTVYVIPNFINWRPLEKRMWVHAISSTILPLTRKSTGKQVSDNKDLRNCIQRSPDNHYKKWQLFWVFAWHETVYILTFLHK